MVGSGPALWLVQGDPALSGLQRSELPISQHRLPRCVGLVLSRDAVHGRRGGQRQPQACMLTALGQEGEANSRDLFPPPGFLG